MNTVNCPKCGTAIINAVLYERSNAPGVTEIRKHPADETERRSIEVTELRVARDEGKPPKIVGHAAVFNQLSKQMTTRSGTKFREKILPGAFKRSLSSGRDIAGLYDHDRGKLLARTVAGTLELREDATGLAVVMTPPDTTVARDTMADIDHGNIRGMSFGFANPVDEWEVVDGENIRTLKEIPLGEISLTPWPVYEGTDVNVRSIEAAVAKLENRAMVESDDQSLQYVSDYVLRAGQNFFEALRSMISTIYRLGDAPLTPADQSSLSDAMDQVQDVSSKIDQLTCCTAGKYQPLNDPADDANDDGRDDEGMPVDDEEDEETERSFRIKVQEMAELGLDTSEIRAGHMTHGNSAPSLNDAAEKAAMALIKAGKVNDGKWAFTSADSTALLGKKPDFDAYGKWFLGIDKNSQADSKATYKYPFGKAGEVYVGALNAIRSKASGQNATAIFDAAGRLLDAIKAKKA